MRSFSVELQDKTNEGLEEFNKASGTFLGALSQRPGNFICRYRF